MRNTVRVISMVVATVTGINMAGVAMATMLVVKYSLQNKAFICQTEPTHKHIFILCKFGIKYSIVKYYRQVESQ